MQGLGVLGEFELIHMHTNEAEEDRERQMDKEQKKRDGAAWSGVGSDGDRPRVLLAGSRG